MNRLIAVIAVLAASIPANAQTIFSNLGPNDTYLTWVGWPVAGPDSVPLGVQVTQASSFVAGYTGHLGTVEAAISLIGGPNSVDLFLAEDNSGFPGDILDSYHFVGKMGAFGSAAPLLKAVSTNHVDLSAGTTYWLLATADGDTYAAWNLNSVGDYGRAAVHAENINNGNWSGYNATRGAFRLEAVPEGSGLAMFVAGLLVAAFAIRRTNGVPKSH